MGNVMRQIYKMKPLVILIFLGVLASALHAQSGSPTPSPTPTADDSDVVKITTSLIQVDVTVTDSRGKIITDL